LEAHAVVAVAADAEVGIYNDVTRRRPSAKAL
jgi:hypothetical protein